MIIDKLYRYGIVSRSKNGQKISKYWVTISASIQQNDQFLEWIIVNIQAPCTGLIQNLVSFSLRDNQNESRKSLQVWYIFKIVKWWAKPQVLGDHVSKYTEERSVSGMDNREHTKSRSVSYMSNSNDKRRKDTHCIELWNQSPFESDILNVLRRNRVNSVVETWVNESLSYLDFSIKRKIPSYPVTVTKRVSIPGDWPKPWDRTKVRR